MALKRQVVTLDEVPEAFRDQYKPIEGAAGFALDIEGDEDTGALKRALERVRAEKDAALAEARQKGLDLASVEASWKTKLDDATTAHAESVKNTMTALKKVTKDRIVSDLSAKLAGDAADLLAPHIANRIKIELDGTNTIPRILDKEGRASALSLTDLEAELRGDARFARVIVASKGSGSGASKEPKTSVDGGADKWKDFNPSKASPKELAEFIEHRKSLRG